MGETRGKDEGGKDESHLLLYLTIRWECFTVKDETSRLIPESRLDHEHGHIGMDGNVKVIRGR